MAFVRRDGSVIWAELTATRLAGGGGQAILRDITARRAAEQRAERLLHLYAATADIDRAIGRMDDPDALLSEACRIAVEVGRFGMAAAGLLGSGSRSWTFRWLASESEESSYLSQLAIALERDGLRSPLAGMAALRENRTIVLTIDDPRMSAAGRDELLAVGLRSHVIVPLRCGGGVVGGFGVFDPAVDAFGPAEVGLIERIADDVSAPARGDRPRAGAAGHGGASATASRSRSNAPPRRS